MTGSTTAASGGHSRLRELAWRWGPAIAWMALIFVLSAQPGLKVSEDPAVDSPIRQLAHLGVYGVLAVLFVHALGGLGRPLRARTALLALVLAVGYGITDEIHQSFVPDRTGTVSDIIDDAIGATLGVAAAWAWGRARGGRRPEG